MDNSHSGSCLCGAISYTISAEPLMAAHCQCTVCRKLGGTGHCSMLAIPRDSLQLTGTLAFHHYTADSGSEVDRGFCPKCGSQVTGANSSMPDMAMICASTLDNPELFKPTMVVFHQSALSWDIVDPSLPVFQQMPIMQEENA